MTNNLQIPFHRAAVQPVECLKSGWALVKPQYWLFVGIAFVGMIIGALVPLGLLVGPMMCGIYLSFFTARRNQPIEFGLLFKGFDFFGPSVIATLLHAIPIVAIVVPTYVLFYVGVFLVAITQQGSEPNPGAMFGLFGVFGLMWVVIIILVIVMSLLFSFAYPLIVDRGVPGFDAVKLSFRAAFANFWRLLGLSILNALVGLLGALICIVGVYLVLPITLAASAMAYEQVFGLRDPSEAVTDLPPPPPTF